MQLVQQQNAWLYSVLQPSGEGPKELPVEAEFSMRQPLQRCLSKRALCRRDCRPLEREDRDLRAFPNALQINPSRLFVSVERTAQFRPQELCFPPAILARTAER